MGHLNCLSLSLVCVCPFANYIYNIYGKRTKAYICKIYDDANKVHRRLKMRQKVYFYLFCKRK